MNSIVQCLCSVDGLMAYFEKNDYEKDINPENPMSLSKGLVVKSFVSLLRQLHSSKEAFLPRDFLVEFDSRLTK